MTPKSVRHLGAIGVTIFICILIFIGTRNLLFCIIAGFGILFFYASGEAFIDYCKMRSTLFFANIGIKGHSSIIESDMFDVQSPYQGEPIYKVMMTGGSSVPYLPFHGFGPVYICPKTYVKRDFQGGLLAIADWYKIRFDYLPELFQNALVNRIEHFNPSVTEIYFADTSPINEKMRGDVYIDLSLRCKKLEASINTLTAQNEDLRVALKSTTSIVREVKSIDEYDRQKPRPRYVQVVER